MGQYRFSVPECDLIDESMLANAQMVGLDGVPWPCRTQVDDGFLTIVRNTDFSGRLLIPVKSSFGKLALTSGTLPECEEAYCIMLELARGTLSRLRNQVSLWQEGGLRIPEQFANELEEITRSFAKTVFLKGDEQRDERVALCGEILEKAIELMFLVTNEFARQVEQLRRDQQLPVHVSVGSVGPTPVEAADGISTGASSEVNILQFQSAPHTKSIGENLEIDFLPVDKTVEVMPRDKPISIIGPMIDFSQEALPGWMDADWPFEKRIQAASAICRKFGERYKDRFQLVHVAAGLNGIGQQSFNYPQQLQLTLEMIESLDHQLANTSLMVSFDQPWGERLAMANGATQAIEIADSLLRYGARVSAMGLDIQLDYFPHGTMVRDPFQWVDLIDRWSQFGLPIVVNITAPNGYSGEMDSRYDKTIQQSFDSNQLTRYLDTVIQMLIARPSISVVLWRHFSDKNNLRFPHSGLFDESGEPKVLGKWFGAFVQQFEATKGGNQTVIENR